MTYFIIHVTTFVIYAVSLNPFFATSGRLIDIKVEEFDDLRRQTAAEEASANIQKELDILESLRTEGNANSEQVTFSQALDILNSSKFTVL